MGRDPELQKIIDRADEQRRASAARVPAPRPASTRKPPPTQRLAVYRELAAGGVSPLWWAGLVLLPFLPVVWDYSWGPLLAAAYGAALLVRLGLREAAVRLGFARFRKFPAGLGFPVDGWAEFLDDELASNARVWCLDVVLEVARGDGADEQALAAAEDLFMAQVNCWTPGSERVSSGAASDLRKHWVRQDGKALCGSANLDVAGEIYRFIQMLEKIQRKAGGVQRVSLRKGGGTLTLATFSHRG
jgi:hypothetical protein